MLRRWQLRWLAVVALFAVLVALPTGGLSAQEERFQITVALNELDVPGISGTADLTTTEDGGTRVSMELQGGELDGNHPTHIHDGKSCADFDPDPLYPLETVELSEVTQEGISETTLHDVSLQSLLDGEYVILVHQSPEQLTTYLVCGDIGTGQRTSLTALELAQGRSGSTSDAEDEANAATRHDDHDNSGQGESVRADRGLPSSGVGTAPADDSAARTVLPAGLATLVTLMLLGSAAARHRRRAHA
jgi:hypothetical protein